MLRYYGVLTEIKSKASTDERVHAPTLNDDVVAMGARPAVCRRK